MIHSVSYTSKLDECVENENLIPYRLHPNARYRNNCYYWVSFEERWIKIEEVLYDFDTPPTPTLDHVIVRDKEGHVSYLCTDLSVFDFRLERDKFDIRNQEIINSKKSFAGGEIEYWFFKNKITSMDVKYKGFWMYLDPYSDCRIDANKYYFIKADLVDGVYKNVRFILDPENVKFKKRSEIGQDKSKVVPLEDVIIKKPEEILKEERKRKESKVNESKPNKKSKYSHRRRKRHK